MRVDAGKLFVLLLWLASPVLQADIVVTDDAGLPVQLAQPAMRVVSLSPHLTEMMFTIGAGEHVIATVDYADYPPQAQQIARIGSNNAWDFERIVALQPDLVLVWQSGSGARLINKLRQLGLTVYVSEPQSFDLIASNLRRLGQLNGKGDIASLRATAFTSGIEQLRQRYADQQKLRVFLQIWDQPLMTINGHHLMSQILNVCGAVNLFADLDNLAPSISREAVLLADPQVIVFANQKQRAADWQQRWQVFAQMTAVKQQAFVFVDPNLISRQTSRVLQGAEYLCQALDSWREP
ncbi:MAG: cobalamin-binding protein [Chromatiales bacterium]|jgi:iron complex transport system substrate-binding protein